MQKGEAHQYHVARRASRKPSEPCEPIPRKQRHKRVCAGEAVGEAIIKGLPWRDAKPRNVGVGPPGAAAPSVQLVVEGLCQLMVLQVARAVPVGRPAVVEEDDSGRLV